MSATLAYHSSLIQSWGFEWVRVPITKDVRACCTEAGCHNRTHPDIQDQ